MLNISTDKDREVTDMEELVCTGCGDKVHPLAIFPNDLCLECFANSPEGKREVTAEELSRMWGWQG
jgi:hypothetical protein